MATSTSSNRSGGGGSSSTAELVIITGMSGSGKGTVLKSLEDLGYYAVDNLPIDLIPKLAELAKDSPNIHRAALVVDIREGAALQRFPKIFHALKRKVPCKLLFLEADDATLVRRFSETRRPHPLGVEDSVPTSIKRERRQLISIRRLADHVIETSKFNVHELRDHVRETFGAGPLHKQIRVYINSFGFRHGVPSDSDLVFDVRFLPNPNYIPAFKQLTGRHPSVARYIRSFPQTMEFIERISELLIYLLPHYIEEGKTYLTISFGCTGGHHRSVMMGDEIRKRLAAAGFRATCNHRDIARPV
jgi:UPF0042 nucleotide-binding protein